MLLVFYLIVLVKMMLVFIPKEIMFKACIQKNKTKKKLSPCFLTCAVRHAFNAIILFYRSHSPIAKSSLNLAILKQKSKKISL